MKKFTKYPVTGATNRPGRHNLSKQAENIADLISEFLDSTSRMEDLNDYLDEYDLDHISRAADALYDFSKDVSSTDFGSAGYGED